MTAEPAGSVPPPLLPLPLLRVLLVVLLVVPLLLLLLVLVPGPGQAGAITELPPFSTAAHSSILENMVSRALSATVIIIITIIISGSVYLCFLKYICSGCCKATQVAPARRNDPRRPAEQV